MLKYHHTKPKTKHSGNVLTVQCLCPHCHRVNDIRLIKPVFLQDLAAKVEKEQYRPSDIFAENLRDIISRLVADNTAQQIADILTRMQCPTPRGKTTWHATSVRRLVNRLGYRLGRRPEETGETVVYIG